MKSKLLDKGTSTMWVYPAERHTDKRGQTLLVPSKTPIKFRATVSTDRGADAELPGQVSIPVLKVIARNAPVGSWAMVLYDGYEWDIAAPPIWTPGVSKATRHVEFSIRGRNAPAVMPEEVAPDGP